MIIKVQNDQGKDRFLVEAAYINWCYPSDEDHIILEVHTVVKETVGVVSRTGIEEEPSLRLRIYNGDRVFVMNADGKTIDSKRIDLIEVHDRKLKSDADPKCLHCGWAMGEREGEPLCPKCNKEKA